MDAATRNLGVVAPERLVLAEPGPSTAWPTAGLPSVSQGFMGYGMLLTHDCEYDKRADPKQVLLTFARILAIPPEMRTEVIETMRRRIRYRSFFLRAHATPPFPASYVDFASLTTVKLAACSLDDRYLSLTDELRHFLRKDLVNYFSADRTDAR